MSQTTSDVSNSDVLETTGHVSEEPQDRIEATSGSHWWVDPETGERGQFSVSVEYEPEDLIVYPESLVDYFRTFEDEEIRPFEVARHVWTELAGLLYTDADDAGGRMCVELEAKTLLDEYSVIIGEPEE